MFPALPVSRLLFSLNDSDVPLHKPFNYLYALMQMTAYLPRDVQAVVLNVSLLLLLNMIAILCYELRALSSIGLYVLLAGIVGLIILIGCLEYKPIKMPTIAPNDDDVEEGHKGTETAGRERAPHRPLLELSEALWREASGFAGEYVRRDEEGDTVDKSIIDEHTQGKGESRSIDDHTQSGSIDDIKISSMDQLRYASVDGVEFFEVKSAESAVKQLDTAAAVADPVGLKERVLELMVRERLRVLRARKDRHRHPLAKSPVHLMRSLKSAEQSAILAPLTNQDKDIDSRQRATRNGADCDYELLYSPGPEEHLSSYMLSRNPLRKNKMIQDRSATVHSTYDTSTVEVNFVTSLSPHSTDLFVDGWSFQSNEVESHIADSLHYHSSGVESKSAAPHLY